MEFRPYTHHRSIQAIVINQQVLARQLLGRTSGSRENKNQKKISKSPKTEIVETQSILLKW